MTNTQTYQIKLPQFEGPFDLLLFFIERDELDIYNIPITKITNEFLAYIHSQKTLNIELSSEFILFVSTLMRIKAHMLLPRKEVDNQGNEIDPRQELIEKIIEYKRFKEAAAKLAEMEAVRMLSFKRGNLENELNSLGELSAEGTEIRDITLFKLMKSFEKAVQKVNNRQSKTVHTVVGYSYTMEQSREFIFNLVSKEKTASFQKVFEECTERIQAIFFFLSMLELIQLRFMRIITGGGKNNFILEWNDNREENAELFENPLFKPTLN